MCSEARSGPKPRLVLLQAKKVRSSAENASLGCVWTYRVRSVLVHSACVKQADRKRELGTEMEGGDAVDIG